MQYVDKVIILTGATGGIGRVLAKSLSERGAKLLLIARNELTLVELNLALGKKHDCLSVDVTTTQGRDLVIERAKTIGANMLINAAGIGQFDSIENISEQDFEQAIAVNLLAPICLCKRFLADIRTSAPCIIVNIGSALGSIGYPYYTSYCASKFGLRGFTEALHRELSATDDQVFYFAPRATATSMNSSLVDQMNNKLGNTIDTPEHVAKAFIEQLDKRSSRKVVGWPEKLFARLNGFFPELVDRAIAKKIDDIRQFIHTVQQS
ncbi:SDR family oxidoreductase [Colwelliaceae bacterium 6471]